MSAIKSSGFPSRDAGTNIDTVPFEIVDRGGPALALEDVAADAASDFDCSAKDKADALALSFRLWRRSGLSDDDETDADAAGADSVLCGNAGVG